MSKRSERSLIVASMMAMVGIFRAARAAAPSMA
jgi:hypothetical protein